MHRRKSEAPGLLQNEYVNEPEKWPTLMVPWQTYWDLGRSKFSNCWYSLRDCVMNQEISGSNSASAMNSPGRLVPLSRHYLPHMSLTTLTYLTRMWEGWQLRSSWEAHWPLESTRSIFNDYCLWITLSKESWALFRELHLRGGGGQARASSFLDTTSHHSKMKKHCLCLFI